jgi:hypothetical protein
MTESPRSLAVDRAGFDCVTDSDALQADRLCQELLLRFYDAVTAGGAEPLEATEWARGADYFLRDFLIDIKGCNLFAEEPGMIRRFAGNWYIITNLDPDFDLLCRHLEGIRRFYRFLLEHGEISPACYAQVEKECGDLEYFRQRIDDFWALNGDGYTAWDRACPFR